MGLVDYSDSDASDGEEMPVVKSVTSVSKPLFQKVVDRSNPGKIKVSLPQAALRDDSKSDEPPAKRAKMGGGGFSGFNSFLPAPKRTGQPTNGTTGGGNLAKKGLGAGVNLKTGAAPGFSREPEPDSQYSQDYEEEERERASALTDSSLSLPSPKVKQNGLQISAEEVKLVGKPLMFKPLSVARKPAKKKVIAGSGPVTSSIPATPITPQNFGKASAPRPKISLFSMSEETSTPAISTSNGDYQPIMNVLANEEENGAETSDFDVSYDENTPNTSHVALPAVPTPPVSQSLDEIAGDLNLSAAERRQLFGRQKGGRGLQSATKVINFNTDKEYLHNEELRAAGEQVAHNPVKSIAPGKHSLKQLVNAAQSQKDALEESFAKGKSNRAEASSRYGW